MVLRLISAAVVGVALKFPGDIVLNCSAHQQPEKLLVCAITFFNFIKNCLRNTNNGIAMIYHYYSCFGCSS